jgi:hypothetical protein
MAATTDTRQALAGRADLEQFASLFGATPGEIERGFTACEAAGLEPGWYTAARTAGSRHAHFVQMLPGAGDTIAESPASYVDRLAHNADHHRLAATSGSAMACLLVGQVVLLGRGCDVSRSPSQVRRNTPVVLIPARTAASGAGSYSSNAGSQLFSGGSKPSGHDGGRSGSHFTPSRLGPSWIPMERSGLRNAPDRSASDKFTPNRIVPSRLVPSRWLVSFASGLRLAI